MSRSWLAPVTPSLNVKGADKLIDFLQAAFGGEELSRMQAPVGPIMHAEVRIGDSIIMIGEAMMDPPTASSLMIYVKDCEAVWKQAQGAGRHLDHAAHGDVLG